LAWSKKDRLEKSPNICASIDRLNNLSNWFSTIIIKCDNIKDRIAMIKLIVQVAVELKNLQNYNSLNSVVSSLNNSAVRRLKNTFSTLQKELSTIDELQSLMSNNLNFKKHRELVDFVTTSCIPFLGMYLTDLTFIGKFKIKISEDGNKNITKNGMINFQKRVLMSRVILKIKLLQQRRYDFKIVPQLYSPLLKCSDFYDDDKLYDVSLILEPKLKN
jgi:son of sevenless